MCFGEPVNHIHLNALDRAQNGSANWSGIGLFRNLIQTPVAPVRIFPDGTYINSLKLDPCLYSHSLSGLNMLLPIDYIPAMNPQIASTVSGVDVFAEIRLTERFAQQLAAYPQEKVHLHTDRDVYVPGEKKYGSRPTSLMRIRISILFKASMCMWN